MESEHFRAHAELGFDGQSEGSLADAPQLSNPAPVQVHPASLLQERVATRSSFIATAQTSRFLRLVASQAEAHPDEESCVWIDGRLQVTDSRTYGGLWRRGEQVAQLLFQEGVREGDRVMLCFNFGLDFLDAFMGCLRLGAVAVPVYPPNPLKLQEALKKLSLVVSNCGAKHGLLDKVVNTLRSTTKGWPAGMSWLVPRPSSKDESRPSGQTVRLDMRGEDDIAFLQYTSGSTGDPKGVQLTFGNIYSNMQLNNALEPRLLDPETVGCSWLPQFHDMGLLAATLYPLARGRKQVFMSPTLYLKQPVLWIEAMSAFRCTWTTAPNFSYGLSARKMLETPQERRPRLDLSRVVSLCNAAEPVRLETMREFLAAFGEFGLDNALFFPSYGLAEHTVLGTTSPVSIRADPDLSSLSDRSGRFVACGDLEVQGRAGQLVDVRIVDAEGCEVEDGQMGEIWMRSGSCGQGYWGNEELSKATFGATLSKAVRPIEDLEGVDASRAVEFMRTGDEGFVERQEATGKRRLFVCGRIKDVIIVRGKNIYPQDVESTAEKAAGGALRLNSSAAYQSVAAQEEQELEAADLVCELKSGGQPETELSALCDRMASAIRSEHSLAVRRLLLIRPRCIPKTTSGKIRRKETRSQAADGRLLSRTLMVWEDLSVAPRAHTPRSEAAGAGGEEAAKQEERAQDMSLDGFLRAVSEAVAEAVGMEAGELDAEQPMAELGLESLAVATLTYTLYERLGVEVGPEVVLQASSVAALARVLHEQMEAQQGGEAVQPASSVDDACEEPSLSARRDYAAWRADESFRFSKRMPMPADDGSADHASAGPLSVLGRALVQGSLILWLLLSMYLCAVPALILFARISDAQIFPFQLFFDLVEPTPFSPVRIASWGVDNGIAVSDVARPSQPWIGGGWAGLPLAMAGAAGVFLVGFTLYVVALKWVVLGRVREGQYELWGWFYWRRWLVQRHLDVLHQLLSPLLRDAAPLSFLYTLLGASVGRRSDVVVQLSEVDLDLLRVGERAAVSPSASLITAVVSRGFLHLRRIDIGEGCSVQDAAVLCPGVVLPRNSRVMTKAVVTTSSVPHQVEGATLAGHPARIIDGAGSFGGQQGTRRFDRMVLPLCWLLCLLALVGVALLPLVALYKCTLEGAQLSAVGMVGTAMGLWALFWVLMALETLAFKHLAYALFLPRPAAASPAPDPEAAAPAMALSDMQTVRISSRGGVLARECAHRLDALMGRFVLPYLWGGVGIRWWYQAMGARIGADTMFSMGVTLSDWDSVDIGSGVLLGGGCTLKCSAEDSATGQTVIHGVRLAEGVTLGANSWVGPGSCLGPRALVTSQSHVAAGTAVPAHAVVVGERCRQSSKACYVPPAGLPRNPPLLRELSLWALHAAWTCLAVWVALYSVWALRVHASLPAVLLCPLGGGVYQLGQLLALVLCKRAVASRRAGEEEVVLHTLGAWWRGYAQLFCWHLHDYSLLGHCLKGGPFANLLVKAMRGRVHMDAYLGSLYLYDFEQLQVGPGAAINSAVSLSPHVILSRASARLQNIAIGAGATVWPGATLIGHTVVPPRAQLGPASRMTLAAAATAKDQEQSPSQLAGGPHRMLLGVPATVWVDHGLGLEREPSVSLPAPLASPV